MEKKWIILGLLIANCNAQVGFEENSGPELESQDEIEDAIERAVMLNTTTTTTTLAPTTTKDYCHCDMEIHTVDEMTGVIKSPNFPTGHCGSGKCIYRILPHPNMSLNIHLETASFSSSTVLKIWDIIITPKGEYNLFKLKHTGNDIYGMNGFDNYDHFSTAKGVGLKLVFEMNRNEYHKSGFKINFERIVHDPFNNPCPPAYVLVTSEETEVSAKKDFTVLAGCTFLLSPSVEGTVNPAEEMYISIETEEGVYVAIRSYDEEGIFYRDTPSDRTRGKVVDAKRVEVLFRTRSSHERVYQAPKIIAKLTNHSCACPEPVIDMKGLMFFSVQSPGFPDLYCPDKKCTTILRAGAVANKTADKFPVVMIEANCSLAEYDILRVSGATSNRVIFRTNPKNKLPTKVLRPMLVNEEDLKIYFQATDKMMKRWFELHFTRFSVKKECMCSLFNEKELQGGGFVSIKIPSTCKIVHCHWKFNADYHYPPQHISVKFSMSEPSQYDRIYLMSDKITEEYLPQQLRYEQQATSEESPLDFTLSRFLVDKSRNSVLNITWQTIEACTCANETFVLKSEESVVIHSPNYPTEYCPNLLCRHVFYAPPEHYLEVIVDNADIERYHDFLKIYDGNSTTDTMLSKVTGLAVNLQINSTGNAVLFVFNTDESTSKTGYHANVVAHPIPRDKDSNSYLVMILVFIVLVIGTVSIGVYFVLRKKPENYRQLQSMNNPTVSYTSTENGAVLNVAFHPGSNETSIGTEMETELL